MSPPEPAERADETREKLLQVEGLSVDLRTHAGFVRVVDDVTFDLSRGETLGLVGESGSGKTVSALAVLGLIAPPHGRVAAGSVRIDGTEMLGLDRRALRIRRGRELGMVFQEPRRNLNPAFTVGDQIAESIRSNLGANRKDAWARAVQLLDLVQIPKAKERARHYPHQFSGGMAQRVLLAIALSCSPKILIADEPTTALDVTVQAEVLDLIRELQAQMGLAVLFISHDLGVIAQMCDRVAVMYAGQVVERAGVDDLFYRPRHPYTSALLDAIPDPTRFGERMTAIPGNVPSAHDWPRGCRFQARCAHAADRCRDEVPPLGPEATARCVRTDELTLGGVK